jgi:hypothetical protein
VSDEDDRRGGHDGTEAPDAGGDSDRRNGGTNGTDRERVGATDGGENASAGLRESRADRLRRRRGAQRERVEDDPESDTEERTGAEPDHADGKAVGEPNAVDGVEADSAVATADADTDTDAEAGGSVKDEQVGTYMYLPKDQKREVEHRYTVLKAEFEYAFDRDFEKNRHFFPLLVEHGLSGLDGADADDVRGMLQSLEH